MHIKLLVLRWHIEYIHIFFQFKIAVAAGQDKLTSTVRGALASQHNEESIERLH